MAMSILERYGIGEVGDLTLYNINADGSPGSTYLDFDSLKMTNVEQTAEQKESKGGKGNTSYIVWDFGKEITLTAEDCMFSSKSLAAMFGNGTVQTDAINMLKSISFRGTQPPSEWIDQNGVKQPIVGAKFNDMQGKIIEETALVADTDYYSQFSFAAVNPKIVVALASSFPGTYYCTCDTYARSEITGRDERFQIILPKVKINAEQTITMEAEGDPTVFNMTMRVLRPRNGEMMKLVQYATAV